MTIRAPNLTPGSRARSPYNEFVVSLPATDFFGIAASQTCTAGTPLTLSGSYCRNITTTGFGCDLRIPVTPVMILSDATKIVSLLIEGLDHLGRPVSEVVTKTLAFATKNHHAGRVEGLDPHAVGALTEQVAHTFTHFGSCLIGEGDCQNLRRPSLFLCQQVRDSMGEHSSLARTRSGDNQQGLASVFHGCALLRV